MINLPDAEFGMLTVNSLKKMTLTSRRHRFTALQTYMILKQSRFKREVVASSVRALV